MSQKVIITKEQSRQRLDKFLAGFDAEKSRSFWQKKIQNGEVLVNKNETEAKYILRENDQISILTKKNQEKNRKITIPDIEIIHEDRDIIVINKPIGVIAQSASSSNSPSVSDFLIKKYPTICEVGEEEQRCGIVHRLDKDTSGIMIIAKNNKNFIFLKNQFKNRLVEKTYTALVHGKVEPSKGSIDLRIGRSKTDPTMQTVIDSKKKENIKSREALTLYKTIQNFTEYTLLEVQIKTGRMHQIRVHMKAIGHPVVGDQKYNNQKIIKATELKRQFLHANSLRVSLPNGKNATFESPLPKDLQDFLLNIAKQNRTK